MELVDHDNSSAFATGDLASDVPVGDSCETSVMALPSYAVVFDEGPIGLNLEDGQAYGIEGAVVRALKGRAKASGQIFVGDIVSMVNNTRVLCMPYVEAMEAIRNTPPPKTLQFVPKCKLVDVQQLCSRGDRQTDVVTSNGDVKWEENVKALKAIRRCMPVSIRSMSEAELQTTTTPNGKVMSREMARKFKRTNVLELLRIDPADIMNSHPSRLENLRQTGLTVSERQALHAHLRDAAEHWENSADDEPTQRKLAWFKALEETFTIVVRSYDRHVAQYGPIDNHPCATSETPDVGCPLLGKQCPIQADMAPAYNVDLGYADGDVYMDAKYAWQEPIKCVPDIYVPTCWRNPRAPHLKKHYKNVRLAAEANGACELIEMTVDMMENKQLEWFKSRLKNAEQKTETAAIFEVKTPEFIEFINQILLTIHKLNNRTGSNSAAASLPANDGVDPRSGVECGLSMLLCESIAECLAEIQKRMDEVQASHQQLWDSISMINILTAELKEKSAETLSKMEDKGPPINRKIKSCAELLKEAEETNAAESGDRVIVVDNDGQATSNAGADLPGVPGERPPNSPTVLNQGVEGRESIVVRQDELALAVRECAIIKTEISLLLDGLKNNKPRAPISICKSNRNEDARRPGMWRRLLSLLKRLWRTSVRRLKQ